MFTVFPLACLLMQAGLASYIHLDKPQRLFTIASLLLSAAAFIAAFNVEEGLTLFVFCLGPLALINVLLKKG